MKTVTDEIRSIAQLPPTPMKEVQPSQLGIRNRMRLFYALEKNGTASAVVVIVQKSRIVLKDVERVETIVQKLSAFCNLPFGECALMIDAPLCSKAERAFAELGYRVVINAAV